MNRLLANPVALMLMALGMLTACVPQSPGPGPGPSRPQACTFEYAPVCGQRGDRTRTFSNACMARADGFRVIHNGQCRRPEQQTACPAIYMPVCAVNGARWRTFSNSCLARADNFRVLHQGGCR
ncbi:Kazal-type serine protease inhibitor domain-containing protein [Hoeflea sp. 108]|uniref:Kazal-type serine protease inhibitor family protein n=1 Tax=Hoeflea sp. 108 TaxID=1116369 RepID=UPI0003806826|nr:Kazal-type serine protease inhibitor domain-containing protein [Hoeflea sp. 108]